MRNSTASILWILIFSFGVLWVLADTQVFDAVGAGPRNLGTVNGDEISLEEYNQRVSFYTDQFAQQSGRSMSPEMRAMYENQAWEDLVAARLIEQKINELGITVTDRELMDMVTGDNPAPFIRQQFQQEDGTIDRIALRAAIEAPENSEIWIMIEQQLRENRRQEKLNNFISSGMKVSSLDIRNEYIRSNSFADIEFVRFPFSDISNDEIVVTDDELRQFYRNNSSRYQRSETYRFRFVSWDKTPTAEDTTNTVREIEDLRTAFAESTNDSLFVLRYQSAVPFRGSYVAVEDLREEYAPVIDLDIGEVSDVVMVNGDPHVFKKVDQRGNEIKFAVLSYNVEADPIGTIDRLAEAAEEFQFYANADGFEEEAAQRGLEVRQATATKDNPFIPGLGASQQTLQALEGLRANRISDPIELDNQFIVVQLLERTPEGTRPFEEVRSQVENAVRTEKRKAQMTGRVRELLQSNSDLEAIAAAAEREIQSAEGVRMGGSTIPGAGRELRVIGAIFEMEEGQTSGVIEGDNAVFVIRAIGIDRADPMNMSSAERTEIRNRLEQERFMAFNQVFIERLKEGASIRDNRSQILR
ncbi:peptidylprolyl isomerase [Rhodohalobacter halophilus]|uniref:peptidylprolyl isomerase n=1 Tax=Rhodohalobacter halophilus TaxID=1812810 RepID=UPI001FDFB014|nr:SurA N-terminal domain-containing protein [Rhodohalobacter halophilus]